MVTVRDALDRAAALRKSVAALPAHVRSSALKSAAAGILDDLDILAQAVAGEGIKTIREARAEVRRCAATLDLAAAECLQGGGEVIAFDQVPQGVGRIGWWSRRPLGVVVAVTPYNDPLNLVAHKIGPAVAAGAPIIVKPHPGTPRIAHALAERVQGSALPPGMIQIVEGGVEEVRELVSDERVAVVSFTGGTVAGREIARLAAGKRLLMELGGVCASLVAGDADLDQAVEALVPGITWAAGQNCVHTQRIDVVESLFPRLAARLSERLTALRVGDRMDERTDVGPLIDEAHARRVEQLVRHAQEDGARILCGGRREGRYLWPTLVTGVPPDHPLLIEEVFAPVSVIQPVPSALEGIARMEFCAPMINASIFTRDLDLILRFRTAVDAGTILVNDSTDFRIDAMPFGGNGSAGLGREGVRFAVDSLTEPQVVCLRS